MMLRAWSKNNEGVNILLDLLFMMAITIIVFTVMLLLIQDIQDRSDRIVLREEFDIISNDIANRLSAFSNEIYLNEQAGDDEKADIGDHSAYFDLPELVKGKQYEVKIRHDAGNKYTVTVTSTSNSDITSSATFYSAAYDSNINIREVTFNSQPGRYEISYIQGSNDIKMEGVG
jgi:hypothetical protein